MYSAAAAAAAAPIFGKVIAEWSSGNQKTTSPPSASFLFRVLHGSASDLHVIATDFQSNTFQAFKSRQQLEDLRDDVGIGGSWSEFVDYIATSLKSGDVKLIMDGLSELGGASNAKLIAQKAKGMPRISISLSKVTDGAAGEAMAKISMELYKEFKEVDSSLVKEQESKYQLTKVVATEQLLPLCCYEKNETLKKQLDMVLYLRKHKSQKINGGNSDSTSAMASLDSPDKQTKLSPAKVPKRVVPAHRRSKVRGVVLDDTEDDAKD